MQRAERFARCRMHTEPGFLGYWLDVYWRWKLVVLTSLCAAAVAYALSLVLPSIYQATSVFYSPQNVSAPDYVAGTATMAQTPFVPAVEEKAASISVGILRSQDIFQTLAGEFPERSRNQLRKNVSIDVSREFMIEVVVRDRDPQLASRIANRFPGLLQEFQQDQIRNHMDAIAVAARTELDAIDMRLAGLRSPTATRSKEQSDAIATGGINTDSAGAAGSLSGATDSELRATATRLRSVLLEAMTQRREPAAPVVVVQKATPGERPVFPIPLLNTVVAGISGLAFGCYYALFCAYLDRRRKVHTARNLTSLVVGDNDFAMLRRAIGTSI